MTTRGVFVTMEAQPGREQEVERLLVEARPLVDEEAGTVAWFAVRLGPTSFGVFDAFDDEAGREAHLSGRVAQLVFGRAEELFAGPPTVQQVDVLADKLPAGASGAAGPAPAADTGAQDGGGGWKASEWAADIPGEPTHGETGREKQHGTGTAADARAAGHPAGGAHAEAATRQPGAAAGDDEGGWQASQWAADIPGEPTHGETGREKEHGGS